jgi:hypothetical protein
MNLVGTWRLLAEVATDSAGLTQPTLFGPTPLGTMTFDRSGCMIVVIADGRPDVPVGQRMFMAYTGRYEFDGHRLTTFIDAASSPSLLATPQVRHVRSSDADRIVLSPPTGFMGQADVRRELTWERIGTRAP